MVWPWRIVYPSSSTRTVESSSLFSPMLPSGSTVEPAFSVKAAGVGSFSLRGLSKSKRTSVPVVGTVMESSWGFG